MNKKEGDLILRVGDGRSWIISYRRRVLLRGLTRSTTATAHEIGCHGWEAFAHNNSLQLGDVCTFELITSSNKTPNNISLLF